MRLVLAALLIPTLAHADRAPTPPTGTAGEAAPVMRRPPLPVAPTPPHAPAPEIAALAKTIAGTYTCKGNRLDVNGSSTPLQTKLVVKLDIGGGYITYSWTDKTVNVQAFATYDEVAKQWTRFMLANDTSHAVQTTLGEKAGEWVWEGPKTTVSGSTNERYHEKFGKGSVELWDEEQLGGTWHKTISATCKR